jgi:hypothetical protein
VRAFGAFEAKRLFSAPPSPICDRENAPMTDMQDQILPNAGNLKWLEKPAPVGGEKHPQQGRNAALRPC